MYISLMKAYSKDLSIYITIISFISFFYKVLHFSLHQLGEYLCLNDTRYSIISKYHKNFNYWDRKVLANHTNLDQTALKGAVSYTLELQ